MTFDAAGEVLTVAVSEARFTADEKALLMAARIAELSPRGQHGHLLSETTDPANQYRWSVPNPKADFLQQAINKKQDDYKKKYPDADLSHLLWRGELT